MTDNALRVPEEYYRHERARLRKNDILLAIKGASIALRKSVAFIEDIAERTIVNGTVFRFQAKNPNNPFYIAALLDSELMKSQIRSVQIPNNAVSYVDKPSILALRIPLPPKPIQDEIAQYFRDAYDNIRTLRIESDIVADKAKRQVERMILGKDISE